jgi:UDP-N-acetylmuramate dehydrogenase
MPGGTPFHPAALSARISPMKRSAASLPRFFREALERPLQRGVSLGLHSSFRIGGKADFFFTARSPEELKSCLAFAHEHSLPYYVIGSGTNMLFADEGYRGLVLKNEVRGVDWKKGSGRISVLAGTPLADLVSFALEEGWAGLEFAAGIPGTVGGAVFGNAGAWGYAIGQLLREAVLLDGKGWELRVGNEYFEFGYRHSSLKKRHLTIQQVVLGLRRDDRGRIRAAAGYLLEKVGAKELRKGGAAVYAGHANFILNCGGATSADIRTLARTLKARVKKEFGITLEEEIIYLPAGLSMPRASAP